MVTVECSFRGEGFLGIKARTGNCLYYLVNVYSACSLPLKRALWKDILALKGRCRDGRWIIGGDFNAVRRSSERVGISLSRSISEWREFDDFNFYSGLIDVPCWGKIGF